MFEHSIKVPRVYKLAGNIVRQVKEEGASLKSLVFQEKNQRNHRIQALFALVVETVKHESHLNELFTKTGLLVNEPRLDPWLARVLLTEVLWGKRKLSGESKPVKIVLQYLDQCNNLVESICGKSQEVDVKKVLKPRYVRINTLHLTAADAVKNFQDEGWNLVRCTSGTYDTYLKQVENLGQYDFMPDYHVKVVFVFAPNTPFYDCPLYHNGEIFLQDKATCLAAFLLSPTPGSIVLDMCAAPGMKTTHLAAIMKNEGTIYSVEQNEQRYKVLCQFVETSGATCVKVINQDVATIRKEDCPNVEYILLDPSCSGSGINRAEMNDLDYDMDSGRVGKLAAFQAKLLRHALNEFKTAKRVVYSTCSLYPQENEEVIKDVIHSHKGKFRLVSVKERLNNNWNNVGDMKYDIGEKCLYARPESDYTSGFFLAMFERIIDNESGDAKIKIDSSIKIQNDEILANQITEKRKKSERENELSYKDNDTELNLQNDLQVEFKNKEKNKSYNDEDSKTIEIHQNDTSKKNKKKSDSLNKIEDVQVHSLNLGVEDQLQIIETKKKRKKKYDSPEQNENELESNSNRKKEKKSKVHHKSHEGTDIVDLQNENDGIKKKKKCKLAEVFSDDKLIEHEPLPVHKKSKKRNNDTIDVDETSLIVDESESSKKSKLKKFSDNKDIHNEIVNELHVSKKKKSSHQDSCERAVKKNKPATTILENDDNLNVCAENSEIPKKKKKKNV